MLGSAVEDPRNINRQDFVLFIVVGCIVSGLMTYVFAWTDDLLCILGVSFLSSTTLNSVGFLLQVTDAKKVVLADEDTYKSCSV